MAALEHIAKLVDQSFNAEAAEAFRSFVPTDGDLDLLRTTGVEVLTNVPYRPGACAMMSAVFAARMQMYSNAPIYVVAGNLRIRGNLVFGDDSDFAKAFQKSSMSWDGHCWLMFGRYVVDVSLFRTAYSKGAKALLANYVRETFGEGRGLMLFDQGDPPPELSYEARYVLTYDQVTNLVGGFQVFLEELR